MLLRLDLLLVNHSLMKRSSSFLLWAIYKFLQKGRKRKKKCFASKSQFNKSLTASSLLLWKCLQFFLHLKRPFWEQILSQYCFNLSVFVANLGISVTNFGCLYESTKIFTFTERLIPQKAISSIYFRNFYKFKKWQPRKL